MLRSVFALALVLASLIAGCDEPLFIPLQTANVVSDARGTAFDPRATGTITGKVFWAGPILQVPPFKGPLSAGSEGVNRTVHSWLNPHAPLVDADRRGVAEAVVFLREVAPDVSRPWDLDAVQVEMKNGQFHIHQGGSEHLAGFVRPGDPVSMASHQEWFEILQARGAAFFSLAFPEPGPVRTRSFLKPGRVELISGAGHFWMRGHLFVVTHPYYTNSDAAGQFTLPHVPPGEYQIVCWHPNWHAASHEIDVGTLLCLYLAFEPPAEIVQTIRVEQGKTSRTAFKLSAADFKSASK